MHINTDAFQPGGVIPRKYTGDDDDVAPPLVFRDVPAGARSLALIVDDPDAPRGTYVHWVAYDLPPATESLPEGGRLPTGAKVGVNDFGTQTYGGPAPPPGKPHRYFFKLYALDKTLDLAAGATKREVEQAMRGHVVAEAQVMGTYRR